MQLWTINHWNNIYATQSEDEVSWFQHYPKTSMEFVEDNISDIPTIAERREHDPIATFIFGCPVSS